MKVVLVNPPAENTLQTEVPEVLESERGHNPPLGILYLASSLLAAGHEVEVVDAQVEGLDYPRLKDAIAKARPQLVGVTAMSFTLIDAIYTAAVAKAAVPDAKVALGGPHPTIYPTETAALSDVDYAIVGEGERTIVELAGALDAGTDASAIKGVSYKTPVGVRPSVMPDFIEDLDSLPFPARKLTPYMKYSSLLAKRTPVTTMFTSRGCPYRCLFCDRPQMGKRFRARSAANVGDEMEECVRMGIREFLVYDDTFTIDRKRVLDVCSEIKGRGLDIGWDVRARVNTVDEEMLRILKGAGCERIHYGVESGNENILGVLRKGITLKQAQDAFRMTREAGIDTLAYFMIGSPRETRATIEDTIRFAIKLAPDYVHFSVTTPFPATDLYRMGLEEGILKSDYWLKFAKNPTATFTPALWEENIRREELIRLMHSAYRRFYLRGGYVLRRLRRVKSGGELLRKARAGLGVLDM